MLDYLWFIVVVLIVLGYAWYMWYLYKTQGKEVALAELRETAYKLMLKAEKEFNKKQNKEKLAFVVNTIIATFPDKVEKYIDKEQSLEKVEGFIQFLFDKTKDKLDDGEINGSVE